MSFFDEFVKAVWAVYDWQYRDGDLNRQERLDPRDMKYKSASFLEVMVHAYRKADAVNKKIIGRQWPYVSLALKAWEAAGDYGNDLFREFQIGRFRDDSSNHNHTKYWYCSECHRDSLRESAAFYPTEFEVYMTGCLCPCCGEGGIELKTLKEIMNDD